MVAACETQFVFSCTRRCQRDTRLVPSPHVFRSHAEWRSPMMAEGTIELDVPAMAVGLAPVTDDLIGEFTS
jgi:hypothetical protein